MNKTRLLGAVCAFMFVFSHSVAAVTVNSGETCNFSFDSLTPTFSEPVNTSVPVQVDIKFTSNDIFGPSESMVLMFNEDSPSGSNFYTGNLSLDYLSGVSHIYRQFTELYWQDLEGFIRLTMGTGSVEISEIEISVAIPGQRYRQVFVPTVGEVPIPPAILLFGSGLLGLIGMAKRKNTRTESAQS